MPSAKDYPLDADAINAAVVEAMKPVPPPPATVVASERLAVLLSKVANEPTTMHAVNQLVYALRNTDVTVRTANPTPADAPRFEAGPEPISRTPWTGRRIKDADDSDVFAVADDGEGHYALALPEDSAATRHRVNEHPPLLAAYRASQAAADKLHTDRLALLKRATVAEAELAQLRTERDAEKESRKAWRDRWAKASTEASELRAKLAAFETITAAPEPHDQGETCPLCKRPEAQHGEGPYRNRCFDDKGLLLHPTNVFTAPTTEPKAATDVACKCTLPGSGMNSICFDASQGGYGSCLCKCHHATTEPTPKVGERWLVNSLEPMLGHTVECEATVYRLDADVRYFCGTTDGEDFYPESFIRRLDPT